MCNTRKAYVRVRVFVFYKANYIRHSLHIVYDSKNDVPFSLFFLSRRSIVHRDKNIINYKISFLT